MPKAKTHSGASKRFRKTGTGKTSTIAAAVRALVASGASVLVTAPAIAA